ncbi:toxin-antitoxin system YwqK family antitoxin [Fluviicola chungangensis]|uniref:Toxin-antitoxin system YwqK family antitoxin n=1 Tax=Fluviicola chungangensis TaxID=2597671 RepID=A0A556N3C4_9FLAO|nr:hypothetical protein [Fluviicola chungangensis]TSJ46670.1 hypothetical protein FO442_05785 [Fluviicola chungangensis]
MINNTSERKFILAIVLSLTSFVVFAQTEKVTIDGKNYYVYPHQQAVAGMQEYYLNFADRKEVIKRDERNEKIVSVSEEPISELEKKTAFKFPKSYKKYLKDFEEMLEKHPFFMVTTDNGITVDPTPALVSLPDGDYVMYYRDIPFISGRVLRYKNDVVAAFFSIKNNLIEGSSTWYAPDGKTVKTGNYRNSEKTGTWRLYEYMQKIDESYTYDPKESIESRLQKMIYDTTKTTFTFSDGLKNGPFTVYQNQELLTSGNFLADQTSGSWEIYGYKTTVTVDKKGKLIITKGPEKILIDRYTIRSDKKRGKSPIIRHSIIPYEFMGYSREDSLVLVNSSPNDENKYDLGYATDFPDFSTFLTVQEVQNDNIELPEENLTSYEGEEELYEGEYYDYGSEFDFTPGPDYNPNEFYEFVNKKRYKLNDLIDSMGYLYAYEGIVEHYYQNGQLQYRFEVKDGKLVKEEPVYWDNGTIANEVVFLVDSNQYVQRFYDYNGVKYYETYHDSIGNILSSPSRKNPDFVTIGDKEYDRNYGNPTFIYSEDKEIKPGAMPEKILLIEERFKLDSSLAKIVYFYPKSRTLNAFQLNLMGDTVSTQEVIFSEDYLNMNAVKTWKFKNLTLKTIQNGTLDDYWKSSLSDTVPLEKLAFYWEYKYTVEKDDELLVNGKPFTGTFKLKDKQGSFHVSASDQLIQLSLPDGKTDLKLYKAAVKAYLKSGKRTDFLLGYLSEFGGSGQVSHSVTGLFTTLYGVFTAMYDRPLYEIDGQREYDGESFSSRSARLKGETGSVFTFAEGKYLNGKPEGLWTYKDQFGKVRSTIGFKNGEAHGDNLDYNLVLPKPKPKNEDELIGYEDPLSKYEEYPLKKTYYLESKCTYKNGALNGPYTTMNWIGDTLTYVNFVDGAKEGLEFKRNKLFFSQSYYKNGYIDGNVKTYFTGPEKDSILIFDLSFKNGALQGESVAYHSNGKLAKKGFFLSGQPIDDYEAYDTLGFKYQYVKFQYNQPVEEKIWEENELSVRYEFDWRDSIAFNFADITTSSSIDQLIYQVGYSDYSLNEPYYGRPSLVNKTGIDYHITKYYPNDTIARIGTISKGIKTGCWKYFNYFGKKLMEVEYFDSIITVNDSIKFKSKGILYYLDENDNPLSKNWIIEKFEKYDCAHTDHNEERMLYCFWEKDSSQHRKNGYVKNYYDNGSIQNEGWVKDGLPTGIWKLYDVNGNLNQVGEYVMGKRNGRWLKGDLGSVKNMSEICLNPNLENLDAILSYQEKLLDVSVITYQIGKELKRKYYGINMNNSEAPEGYYGEEEIYMNYEE